MTDLTYTEDPRKAAPFRAAYRDGILSYAEERRKAVDLSRERALSPQKMERERETYRKKLVSLLGSPLDAYEPLVCPYRLFFLSGTEEVELYRVEVRMPEKIPFSGLLFLPPGRGKCPLVFAMHGMEGTPELPADLYTPNSYSHMCKRLLRNGAAVFAPQTLMWDPKRFGAPCDRREIDAKLRMTGVSINSLELLFLRRTIDTFLSQERIDGQKIGVCGISYGAYFALTLAAVDTRVKSVYSSCFFNDRFSYPRIEMVYPGLYALFGDAETASLVCPRHLYIEAGEHDCFFSPGSAEKEYEKLLAFYEEAGKKDALRFRIHPGGHKLSDTDEGMDFFFSGLLNE